MDSNELLKDGRILALKVIAEAHLVSKGNTVVDDLFTRDKESINQGLSGGEIVVLHNWLVEEYKAMGLDLGKIIEAVGEKIEDNKLSNYEIKELIRRADILLSQMIVIKKYVK